jgi:hypothetical protein
MYRSSGSNNAPLGKRRFDDRPEKRFEDRNAPRGRPREQGPPRKKKFLWRPLEERVILPGLVTTLPAGLSDDQVELLCIHLRIEEISKKLRAGTYVPPEAERYVSQKRKLANDFQ